MHKDEKSKKNVENKADGASKKPQKLSLVDFHNIVDTNDAKAHRKTPWEILKRQLNKMGESKTESSTRGRDATDSHHKEAPPKHTNQEHQNVPTGSDNQDNSKRESQAPSKPIPKSGAANACEQQHIYTNTWQVLPEPWSGPVATKESGSNKKHYNGVSRVPAKPSRLKAARETIANDGIIYSEISQLFPAPSYHSGSLEAQRCGGVSTNKGRGNQNQCNGISPMSPNSWRSAAEPGMYPSNIYERVPSGQRATRGRGNQSIYNGVSQRPPSTWRHRNHNVPRAPQNITMTYCSEISQLLQGPAQPPSNQKQNPFRVPQTQGVSPDTDPNERILNKTFDVVTEPRRSSMDQALSTRVEPSAQLIPWAQRAAEAHKEQKIQILKRPEPFKVTYTINNEPLRGLPGEGGRVGSCPPIPKPARCVPKELKQVDRMTSADFRHDYNAHVQNMRTRLKNQEHMHYFSRVIRENVHLFKGRVILVLSCGVGTLALMAAREGQARRVYAVDHSMVTNYAELVVKQNHYERTVKVMHGRMADLQLPEKVDGIVCNWMGHSLLWNSDILEVIAARDRWLKRNGFILPDMGDLYLLGAAEPELKGLCNWWCDVYGFNMNAMRRCALSEPRYAKTKRDGVLTHAERVLSLDLRTATKEDLQIDREIRLKVIKDGHLECFTLYFDVKFSRCHRQRVLSCDPCLANGDHKSLWLQTTLFVESAFVLRENHYYAGRFIFRPLRGFFDMKQFEILIKLFVSWRQEGDMAGWFGNRLVAKRWLMVDRHQTVAEVASCQDEDC